MPEELSPRALCSLEDVKAFSREYDTDDDDLLTRFVNTASLVIERESEREFAKGAAPEERECDLGTVFEFDGLVRVGDLASPPVDVEIIDASGVSVSTYVGAELIAAVTFEPRKRRESWRPITGLRFRPAYRSLLARGGSLLVTATWGFPEIPGDVRHACIEQADAWFQDRHHGSEYAADHPVNLKPRRLLPSVWDLCESYREDRI